MNKNKNVVNLDEKRKADVPKVDLDGNPTRREIIDIMTQLTENMNQMAEYLMQDVNTMYSQHVFPFQMRLAVLEDIIKEHGIATEEEITKKVEERIEKLKEQAKEIKDMEDTAESE